MADKSDRTATSDGVKNDQKSPSREDNSTSDTKQCSANTFKNDGSFLEMFKKKLEAEKQQTKPAEKDQPTSIKSSEAQTPSTDSPANEQTETSSRLKSDDTESAKSSDQTEQKKDIPTKKKYSLLSHVGKRPGSKLTLKTGQVKKSKQSDQESAPKDAWSKYMSEVEKYKAHVCSDDDAKVRPLVK